MSWLLIISTIIPLLLKVLEWLKNVDSRDLKPRQRERVGQLLTVCREYNGVCGSKGIDAGPVPVQSVLNEDE